MHDAAVADYSAALSQQPRNPVVLYNRAAALDALGNHATAEADLTTALEHDPHNAAALYNRGLARAAQNNHQGAAHDFSLALEQDPNNPHVCCQHAHVLAAMDMLPEAVVNFTRALVLMPGDVGALRARAVLLQRLGNHHAAVEDAQAAALGAPGDVEVQLLYAQLLRDVGRWDDATTACHVVLQLDGRCVDALNCMGYCLRKLGRMEEAASWYGRALGIVVEGGGTDGGGHTAAVLVRLHNARAYCLAMQGKLQEVLRCLLMCGDHLHHHHHHPTIPPGCGPLHSSVAARPRQPPCTAQQSIHTAAAPATPGGPC